MCNAYLQIRDVNGTITFDCEHNSEGGWHWIWISGVQTGVCFTIEQLCNIAAWVRLANPGSIVEGHFLPEFNAYINS
jgi:hypothetical protein